MKNLRLVLNVLLVVAMLIMLGFAMAEDYVMVEILFSVVLALLSAKFFIDSRVEKGK